MTGHGSVTEQDTDLDEFRAEVRDWCRSHVPVGWRKAQPGVPESEFVAFQQWWFAELRAAGWAVPHWPAEWGGGMSTARARWPSSARRPRSRRSKKRYGSRRPRLPGEPG